jgi:hypothetical protein
MEHQTTLTRRKGHPPVMQAIDKATTTAHPDAELIALCERHRIDRDAVNADAGDMDDDDPVWLAYVSTRDFISDARPQTMVGVLAKARAAKASARMPDGSESVDGMAYEWAWEVVGDLLRLHGEA